MTLQSIDKTGTIETIPLTPAQRAMLITLRRVLISALHLIDSLLGK
jgi:hypothetical protein